MISIISLVSRLTRAGLYVMDLLANHFAGVARGVVSIADMRSPFSDAAFSRSARHIFTEMLRGKTRSRCRSRLGA